MQLFEALATLVADHEVRIDRPRGTSHPRYPEVVYPLDYGFLADTVAADGTGIDLFRGTAAGTGLVGAYLVVDTTKGELEAKLLVDCAPSEVEVVGRFLTEVLGLPSQLLPAPQR